MKKILFRLLKILLCIVLIVSAAFGWNLYDINHIRINNYELYSAKLPSNFNQYRIAFISDFHNAEYYEQLTQKVSSQSPDVILVGGDMVNLDEQTYDNTIALFKGLVNIAPVYMVMGNHEIYHDKLEQLKVDFGNLGVHFLNNQSTKLYKDAAYISLYGFKDPAIPDEDITKPNMLKKQLDTAKYGVDTNTFSLMVMHRANMFDVTYDLGYDLTLAGHIHGGVIRLPIVGGVLTPERDQWFPNYTKGMYYLGKSKMIVSAGLDKQKAKPRFFNPPELVMITLKKG